MNVNEMHLAIQQGVDKINSLQADMLLSEEIDIELNKSMSRFLNTKYGKGNKYGKGFEESQKRIDDLRSLVKEYEAPVIFKEQFDNDFWIDQFRLPSDYLYLVNQRSEVFIDKCDPIGYYLDDNNPVAFCILPMNNLNDGSSFIEHLHLVADPTNPGLGLAGITTLNYSSYTFPQDAINLKNDILTPSNWATGIQVYWEQYGLLSYPNSFIIIIDDSLYTWFNWDSSITNSVSGSSLISVLIGIMYSAVSYDDNINTQAFVEYADDALGAKRLPPANSTREYALNKFIQQDDIFKLLKDPFNTTKYTSPLTTIRGEYIDIYTSDIFIIDKVKITYIRKPKNISLSLGIGCELPDHTHQEIVDMTVSSILEGITDPRYKSHQLEVSKNE
tara:strand:- start:366 stop:1529 length:1164 start_codon:yes stop_codon:yes gene_type:complete